MIVKSRTLFGEVSAGQVGGGGTDNMALLFKTPFKPNNPLEMNISNIGTNCFGFRRGYTVTFDTGVVTVDTQAFKNQVFLAGVSGLFVTSLKSEAFSGCQRLKTVSFPWLQEVAQNALMGTALTAVEMPRLTAAGEGCFKACDSLVSARFAQLPEMGAGMLSGCGKLTDVYLGYDGVVGVAQVETEPEVFGYDNPLAGSGTDPEGSGTITVHVPASRLEDYRNDDGWQSVAADCDDGYGVVVEFVGDYE